jgi:hypothetical protein
VCHSRWHRRAVSSWQISRSNGASCRRGRCCWTPPATLSAAAAQSTWAQRRWTTRSRRKPSTSPSARYPRRFQPRVRSRILERSLISRNSQLEAAWRPGWGYCSRPRRSCRLSSSASARPSVRGAFASRQVVPARRRPPEPSTLNPDPDRIGEERPTKQRPIAPRETFGAVVALPILSNAATWPPFERGSGHPRRHRDASFLPPASAAICGASIQHRLAQRTGTWRAPR